MNENIDIQQINKIATEILNFSKNNLLVNLRFLDLALGQFTNTTVPDTEITKTYQTDGIYFLYNPLYVIKSYQQEHQSVSRDFLHLIFHCIFRHMFLSTNKNAFYWDLACDITVENMIIELQIDKISTEKEIKQKNFINTLKPNVKYMTTECIYYYFLDNRDTYTENEIIELKNLFFADSHKLWYLTKEQQLQLMGQNNNNSGKSDKNNKGNSKNNNSSGNNDNSGKTNKEKAPSSQNAASSSQNTTNIANNISSQELQDIWKNISERIQVDMETFNKKQGTQAGSLMQNLKEINREKYDYTAFLKKFAVMGEVMKINDDEFDYVYYTYGLSLYKKMPLIEPLEYKDVKRIKEFVIAIDTSGSVSGELVQKFVQKTYNILKSTESFFSRINLHIIQCDAEIQEDIKITSQEEFDAYIKNMKILGLGGTDFRPVFDYVDKLIKAKEFTNLKGLIYFTDGYGTFPQKKTPYSTAFLFIDEDYNNYDIPSWAIKLILRKDEI